MRLSILALAAALLGAVSVGAVPGPGSSSTPIAPTLNSISTAHNIPIVNLTSADLVNLDPTKLRTLSSLHNGTAHTDAIQAPFPAIIWLCPNLNCGGCSGWFLDTLPHNVCFVTNPLFGFYSAWIEQPSNEGLSFGTGVGVSCGAWNWIPFVNTCFNLFTPPMWVFTASP